MNTAVTSWRKSTRSGPGDSSSCVEVRRTWRKSIRSGPGDSSNCVEVSLCTDSEGFHLRDSKLGDGSPVFDLSSNDLRSLLNHAGLRNSNRHNNFGPVALSHRPEHVVRPLEVPVVLNRNSLCPSDFRAEGQRTSRY